jgi:medium-chain acyl-[acyl-carrier-protein] hydrolase
MSEAPKEGIETYNVKVYEADAKGRANIASIANYFQNSAWRHYLNVEKALGQLIPKNSIWMMVRLEIKIISIPQWGGDIKLVTWSRGIEKLTAFRDFVITGTDGKEKAKGTATWVVVDFKNRKIQKLDELAEKWPSIKERSALGRDAKKLQALTNPVEGKFFSVKYSDLDVNRHVNNVKYIEWIMDGYAMEFIEANDISKFEINFLGEAAFGDEVAVNAERLSETPLTFLHNIMRKSDGKEICKARITYKEQVKSQK